MDVTCPRCQTDYEFDDALVSERGTTVKCTNCGHQFRVQRQKGGGLAASSVPEVWRIEQISGGSLELRSLVELQRAIRAGRVVREDTLRKGDGPARHVGDIPELEPFFPAARAPEAPAHTMPMPTIERQPVAHTPAYGRPAVRPHTPPRAPPVAEPPRAVAPQRSAPPPRPPPPKVSERPRVTAPLMAPPVPPAQTPMPMAPVAAQPIVLPPPAHLPSDPDLRGAFGTAPTELQSQPLRDDAQRRSDRRPASAPPPVPSRPPRSIPPLDEPFFDEEPRPPARSGLGWIVGGVVVAGAILIGGTVGRPFLNKLLSPAPVPTVSASSGAPRLDKELAAGSAALSEGDHAAAREAFVRATALDEKSLAAWDGLCAAESELAMIQWVGGLSSASSWALDQAATLAGSAGKSCARWGDLARGAGAAQKVGSDLRPVRALAAMGDAAGVRLYLSSHTGEPLMEALVTLAEATKKDAAAVQAAAKTASIALGKATPTSLLSPTDVALAAWVASSTGDAARSQALLSELEKRAPKHPLLGVLRGTAKLEPVKTDAGVADAPSDAPHDAPLVVAVVGTGGGGTSDPVPSGDFRALNKQGYEALAAGEPGKAEGLFKGALAQHPGDIDALYGLGQIARARGEHANAIAYFKQVLDTSPGFAPARLALADEQWGQGQQADAKKNYELYLERMPDGPGAERAKSRTGKTDVKPEAPAPPKEDP